MQNEGLLDLDSATEGVKEFWMQSGGYFNFSSANGTEILKTFLLKEDKHLDLNCVSLSSPVFVSFFHPSVWLEISLKVKTR